MTNGEKIKEIFPEAQIEYGESDVYVWLNHEPVNFSREAWESNYSEVASELDKNSKLEKIRDQLKSNLRGVEITLEVLVENEPLRPKMEGAKTTLEDCLELIDKAETEG